MSVILEYLKLCFPHSTLQLVYPAMPFLITFSNTFICISPTEEKAMYSAELEKHKKEKEEWKRKALKLEDQASALQVNQQPITCQRIISVISISSAIFFFFFFLSC